MDAVGQVVGLNGDVRAESADGVRVLEVGSPVYQSDELVTAHGANVEIRFDDETVLAQGEDARLSIDTYVYNPEDSSATNLVVGMAQGTFRMVTGKIADTNPEGVTMVSPLATIGIRGTGADVDVQPGGTKVGIFSYDGKDLTVTTPFGTAVITNANQIVDVAADGRLGAVRSYSDLEKAFFDAAAPILSIPATRDDGGDTGDGGEGDELGGDAGPAAEGEGGEGEGGDGEGGEGDGAGEGDELAGTEGEGAPGEQVGLIVTPAEGFGEGDVLGFIADTFGGVAGDDSLAGGGLSDLINELQGASPVLAAILSAVNAFTTVAPAVEDDTDELTQSLETLTGSSSYLNIAGTAYADLMNEGDVSLSSSQDYAAIAGLAGPDTIKGTTSDDAISGGSGDDFIYGNGGHDTVDGGTGNDSIDMSYGSGGDTVSGGDGNDTIIGSSYADSISGGDGQDTIDAGYGNDTIVGGAKCDSISGGDGDDLIYADEVNGTGSGYDTVDGGSGSDTIYGAAGDDSLSGGAGADTVYGGDGNDELFGGTSADLLVGGAGDDTIYSNDSLMSDDSSADTLKGGAGDDSLVGDAGHDDWADYTDATGAIKVDLSGATDTVYGASTDTLVNINKVMAGNYDDTMIADDSGVAFFGGKGVNVMTGGAGDDYFYTAGEDSITGSSGTDTVDFKFADEGGTLVMDGNGHGTATSTTGDVTTFSGIAAVYGSNYADTATLDDSGAVSTLAGNGGNDSLTGSANADTIYGDDLDDTKSGKDVLRGEGGDDYLDGGDGDDTLYGGDGSDTLTGGHGDDYQDAGDGADEIWDSGGDDTLMGGAGNDVLSSEDGDQYLDGGADTDTVNWDYAEAVNVDLGAAGAITATHGDYTDTLVNIENLWGGQYDDTLKGDDQANQILGEGGDYGSGGSYYGSYYGDDSLYGAGGADTIDGGYGDDTIDGGSGADALTGGDGSDLLSYASFTTGVTASLDNATVMVGSDTDSISGFEHLQGGSGNDALTAASTTDSSLFGGAGDDSLYAAGTASDTLQGGKGSDKLFGNVDDFADYSDATSGITGTLNGTVSDGQGGTDTLSNMCGIIGSDHDDSIAGDGGISSLYGGDGDDTIAAGAGVDSLYGEDGDDSLSGEDGNDYLSGGVGADTLYGDDSLDATTGADTLLGGGGADMLYGGAGSDSLMGGDDGDKLYGGSGTDTLMGQNGDDTLDGGADADTLIGGDGSDVLDGGDTVAGNNTVDYGTETAVVVNLGSSDFTDLSTSVTYAAGTGTNSWGTDTLSNIDKVVGSGYADRIIGNSHANTLTGGAGDDTLHAVGYATTGDSLEGGAGSGDWAYFWDDDSYGITGGGLTTGVITVNGVNTSLSGIENLAGTDNADTFDGDAGANTLDGRDGDDTIAGRAGDDSIAGSTGDDELWGDDTLDSESGNDYLQGGDGNDTLYGGLGDDTLEGGDGNDMLKGDAGTDWVSYEHATAGVDVDLGNSMVESVQDTKGAGTDTLMGSFEGFIGSAHNDSVAANEDGTQIKGGDGDDSITGATGGTGADLFYGEGGSDSIQGLNGNDTIYGGDDADSLAGGDDADLLYGGYGNDSIKGEAGADTLYGEYGDDSMSGGTEADTLDGGYGKDKLDGGDGGDYLFGGYGDDSDTLDGGAGDDTLEGGSGGDSLIGGTGTDLLTYSINSYYKVNVDLGAGATTFTVYDTHGSVEHVYVDTLDGLEHASLSGSTSYTCTLTGDDGANSLTGGDGADHIFGDDGGDSLYGGDGSDTLAGGTGQNFLSGGTDGYDDYADYSSGVAHGITATLQSGHMGSVVHDTSVIDTLTGIEGVMGTDGDDTMDASSDTGDGWIMEGNNGDDVFTGGAGDDYLDGGEDDDHLDGGAGTDTAIFGGSSGVVVNLSQGTATGQGSDTLSNIENVFGSDADDSIVGNTDANSLVGNDGHDTLVGLGGADTLLGGDGNDYLYGGAGADSLHGGDGADTFYYADTGDMGDTVDEFRWGWDHFTFESSAFGNLDTGTLDSSHFFYCEDYGSTGANMGQDGAVFIYDDYENALYYDADGDDASAGSVVAYLDGSEGYNTTDPFSEPTHESIEIVDTHVG